MKWLVLNTESYEFPFEKSRRIASRPISINPEYIESVEKQNNGKAKISMMSQEVMVEETYEEVMLLLGKLCEHS